ncbi:MAG TPA: DegT/DnrJ/EryC1/StrS family aminotransferase [Chloroflexota bacterium]|jgi:perosamine synthetase|nr:DegT/DnrJ/EryC1/StrS family aminotransferase [Chloroflexota bacterium]
MARRVFDDADLAAVRTVLESGNLSYLNGAAGEALEAMVRERLGCAHAVAVHSAMAGLQMGLMGIGVGEGDEVICDPIVPFGAKAVLYQHARPIFADVDPATHNLAPASIRERITERTKAIVVTHLWGMPAAMDEIMAIAREHRLGVVEDCAHALFATLDGREAGTFGSAGVFSFQQQKHLTTGDGGLLVTDDPYIAEQANNMLRFGVVPPRLSWNFRMNELTAAVAGVQWGRADGYVDEDRRAAALYSDVLGGHPALFHPAADDRRRHVYHIWAAAYRGDATLGLAQGAFQEVCKQEGVQAGFGYIKVPPYLHPMFSLGNGFGFDVWGDAGHCPYRRGYCPEAEALMPRLMMITITTQPIEYHERNAAALGRALARLER